MDIGRDATGQASVAGEFQECKPEARPCGITIGLTEATHNNIRNYRAKTRHCQQRSPTSLGPYGSRVRLPTTLSTRQKTLRKQTKSLERRELRMCAIFRPGAVWQKLPHLALVSASIEPRGKSAGARTR